MAPQTVRDIEQRDRRKMRSRLPAYQIYTSQDGAAHTQIKNGGVISAGASVAQDSETTFVNQYASVATKLNSSGVLTAEGGTTQSIFMPQTSREQYGGARDGGSLYDTTDGAGADESLMQEDQDIDLMHKMPTGQTMLP